MMRGQPDELTVGLTVGLGAFILLVAFGTRSWFDLVGARFSVGVFSTCEFFFRDFQNPTKRILKALSRLGSLIVLRGT